MNIPKPTQNSLAKTVKIVKFSLLVPGDKLFLTTERSQYAITLGEYPAAAMESTNTTSAKGEVLIVGAMNQGAGSYPLDFISEGQHFVYSTASDPEHGIKTTPILSIKVLKGTPKAPRLIIPAPAANLVTTARPAQPLRPAMPPQLVPAIPQPKAVFAGQPRVPVPRVVLPAPPKAG